uniref:RNase III domain-containing protein n=1 Tax=Plectus sambesii TaxID=2011161 RepID=A0A914VR38_9BILA
MSGSGIPSNSDSESLSSMASLAGVPSLSNAAAAFLASAPSSTTPQPLMMQAAGGYGSFIQMPMPMNVVDFTRLPPHPSSYMPQHRLPTTVYPHMLMPTGAAVHGDSQMAFSLGRSAAPMTFDQFPQHRHPTQSQLFEQQKQQAFGRGALDDARDKKQGNTGKGRGYGRQGKPQEKTVVGARKLFKVTSPGKALQPERRDSSGNRNRHDRSNDSNRDSSASSNRDNWSRDGGGGGGGSGGGGRRRNKRSAGGSGGNWRSNDPPPRRDNYGGRRSPTGDSAWEASRDRAPIPLRPTSEQPAATNNTSSLVSHDQFVSSGDDRLPTAYKPRPPTPVQVDSDASDRGLRSKDGCGELEDAGSRERHKWKGVSVSDFDDVGQSDLSNTDDELLAGGKDELKQAEWWSQTVAAGRYFRRDGMSQVRTEALRDAHELFEERVTRRIRRFKEAQPIQATPPPPAFYEKCSCGNRHVSDSGSDSGDEDAPKKTTAKKASRKKKKKKATVKTESSCSSSSGESSDGELTSSESDHGSDMDISDSDKATKGAMGPPGAPSDSSRFGLAMSELERKRQHPARLHPELWFNEAGQTNDGPLCRCSWKSRQTGVRHQIFTGESRVDPCDPSSSNADKLYHYVVSISPSTNMSTSIPTSIQYDDHIYEFEGFSLFAHQPLPDKLPSCRVTRWNTDYTINFVKERPPENYTVRCMELFYEYLFEQLLEMVDVERRAMGVTDGCPMFHVLPRFTRPMPNSGKEVLAMSAVIEFLAKQHKPVISPELFEAMAFTTDAEIQNVVNAFKGQLVVSASNRPSTIRMDQIDRNGSAEYQQQAAVGDKYPVIVHFGVRPSALTYNGNPEYQRASKQYVKFRHLLTMKAKLTAEDKMKLAQKEGHLRQLRTESGLKRDVTVEVSSRDFFRTGLYPDIVQHAMMLLVACNHIRFHWSLRTFESKRIKYEFKNRALLELAFTHPSYRTNYGTNPDHARNSLSNCGLRQPKYGSRKGQQVVTRKRGINTLIDIMSRQGSKRVKESHVTNNERLEYLGDAVIEFLSTIHLFFMFPDLEEGGLATYRSSLVQNKHLAVLAKKLGLDEFMLYAHGPDLCHEADLRHAMANAFEAVMGAIFLDAGLDEADRIFGEALFCPTEEPTRHAVWCSPRLHPLQVAEPAGDRHYIHQVASLQKLTEFEKKTGIYFKHIRLLAKAFTRRNVGYNFLTLGHNQRLEFLGDTVLQLITSEYLYKHFPEHHEGHLSLLRSCLVNNKTQSVICDDLGMTKYLLHPPAFLRTGTPELRLKDKADLVESFLGALYVDRGLEFCKIFCKVCFYPRLKEAEMRSAETALVNSSHLFPNLHRRNTHNKALAHGNNRSSTYRLRRKDSGGRILDKYLKPKPSPLKRPARSPRRADRDY